MKWLKNLLRFFKKRRDRNLKFRKEYYERTGVDLNKVNPNDNSGGFTH
ncbi:hypothetical protein N8334_00290 [Flavobacteriaceae bacterium]|jgi:hypothetical protein|nr:hypothetical protein [Flavobacteriaceae bacterium]